MSIEESKTNQILPSDKSIRSMMERLVPKVDLKTVTTKQFIAMLSQKMGGVDLSSKKQYIKITLTEILDAMDDTEEEEDDDEENDHDEEEDGSSTRKKRRGGARGGLSAMKDITPELAAFFGVETTRMARTDVVRKMWDYIRKNNLQNPEDKREIWLDDKMQKLFHCDKFTMFTMNKYVSAHMEPFPPVNLKELSENSKRKKAGAAERRISRKKSKKRKKRNRRGGGDSDGEGTREKRPRKQVQHRPFRLSDQLASVVGRDVLPRPQVTRLLWVYIKKHNLQNPEDKREILCDDILKAIMGGNERVTIFSMNKHITPHLVEQLDKSAYSYDDSRFQEGEDGNGEEDYDETNITAAGDERPNQEDDQNEGESDEEEDEEGDDDDDDDDDNDEDDEETDIEDND